MKAIKYIFYTAIASAFIIIVIISCKAGPAGPTGTQGLQGPSGANLVADTTMAIINPTDWSGGQATINLGAFQYMSSTNTNLVYVYYSTSPASNSIYTGLPTVLPSAINTGFLSFQYLPYNIILTDDGASPPSVPLYFRVVVIPQP